MKLLCAIAISASLICAAPTAIGQAAAPAAQTGFLAARLLSAPLPAYPPEVKAAGISGTVVLHGTITTNGTLGSLTPVSGPPELQQPALHAASSWVFAPYKLDGSPIQEEVNVSVSFDAATGKIGIPDLASIDTNVPSPTRGGVRIAISTLEKLLVTKVDPIYPKTKDSGAVVVAVKVGMDGRVNELSVVSGPESLRAAASDAIRQWTYKPYLLNGLPVEIESSVVVNFVR
jgi:TonB family protein